MENPRWRTPRHMASPHSAGCPSHSMGGPTNMASTTHIPSILNVCLSFSYGFHIVRAGPAYCHLNVKEEQAGEPSVFISIK